VPVDARKGNTSGQSIASPLERYQQGRMKRRRRAAQAVEHTQQSRQMRYAGQQGQDSGEVGGENNISVH